MEKPSQAATQLTGDVEILLPLSGLVNVHEEIKRLKKEISKAQKDVDFFKKKLSNEKFLTNAPPEVLQKDQSKQAEAEKKLKILLDSLKKMESLDQ